MNTEDKGLLALASNLDAPSVIVGAVLGGVATAATTWFLVVRPLRRHLDQAHAVIALERDREIRAHNAMTRIREAAARQHIHDMAWDVPIHIPNTAPDTTPGGIDSRDMSYDYSGPPTPWSGVR